MASMLMEYIEAKVADQQYHSRRTSSLLDILKGVEDSFPDSPVALAYDDQLSILAIATGIGSVHIYGCDEAASVYRDEKRRAVRHLLFIPNHGTLVVLLEDSLIFLLDLNTPKDGTLTQLENDKRALFPRVNDVTCLAVIERDTAAFLWCGFENSSIVVFSLPSPEDDVDDSQKSWSTTDASSSLNGTEVAGSQELARMCGVPATDGASNGKVIAIEQHPENENFVLVGFSDGQIELHDLEAKIIRRRFDHSTKPMVCVGWRSSSDTFISVYDDKSYVVWNMNEEMPLSESVYREESYLSVPHGKMSGHSAPGSEGPLTIFSTVASQHRVTIQYGEKDTPLNLPSAFVDFVLLDAGPTAVLRDTHTVLVLLKNQLVPVDLHTSPTAPVAADEQGVSMAGLSGAEKNKLAESAVIEQCEALIAGGKHPRQEDVAKWIKEEETYFGANFAGLRNALTKQIHNKYRSQRAVRKVYF